MPRMTGRPDPEPFQSTALFAHRGLHDNNTEAPENSMPAFRKAVEKGYGIELDVQLTADSVQVIFHDLDLERACGVRGLVRDYTFDELQKLRLFGSQERIPALKDFLGMVRGRVPLIVEYKSEDCDLTLCRVIAPMLRKYKGTYCIESFNPLVLLWYRKNRPDVMRGQLSDGFIHQKEFRTPSKLAPGLFLQFLATNFVTRPDFVAYNFHYQGNLSRRLWRRLFRGKSAAWTVRSEEELKKARPHFDAYIFDSFIPPEFPGKRIHGSRKKEDAAD
jgi:glycerophosphoryl diester phosphodiesterase